MCTACLRKHCWQAQLLCLRADTECTGYAQPMLSMVQNQRNMLNLSSILGSKLPTSTSLSHVVHCHSKVSIATKNVKLHELHSAALLLPCSKSGVEA